MLRFLAFSEDINLKQYNDVLSAFLDEYMEKNTDIEAETLQVLRERFNQALTNCQTVFGNEIFTDPTRERAKQGLVYYDLLMPTLGLLAP
ncbi:MAG: hypothetical protein V3U87_13195 [Methylococcaceae bacterium]